ncbi:MAG: HlyD family efflux transporter periplasmic adaptor subunit, partial [Calditrichota bacterium]
MMTRILSTLTIRNLTAVLIFTVLPVLLSCSNHSESISPVRKDITDVVFASGHIIFSDEYLVATNAEGFILKSYVRAGDEVDIGDPLFQLSNEVQSSQLDNAMEQYQDARFKSSAQSPQIVAQRKQIEQAKSQIVQDKTNFERYSILIKTNAVSKLDYEKAELQYQASLSELAVLEKNLEDLRSGLNLNLKNAESQLRIQQDYLGDYFITSTRKGRVLQIYKEQGELARRGELLAKIGSGEATAKLFIAEEDIVHIQVGQSAKVVLNTNPEEPVDAVISKVYPAFDLTEQSFILEAAFAKDV